MNNKKLLKITSLAAAMLVTQSAGAANWLMLQGTEPDSAAPRAKLWGFIQAQYQNDNSDPNAGNGTYIPPKLIGPDLTSQSQFNVNRARIGVRGTGFPLDSKVNYFILAEFGNNGITGVKDSTHVTDASITLNQLPGARIRAGLFKYPGAEEGLQAIHVFDYINFTTVTNQLLLERFPNSGGFPSNGAHQTLPTTVSPAAFEKPVGAFRDVGVQVFDTFKKGDWEHSYAVMIGNGNGLNFGDNDDNKDTYLYWSSELVFGGKGGRRQGMKLFAWNQSGKRTADLTDDSTDNYQEYDRDRTGFGVKYLKRPYRISAEYMTGEGMIFLGPQRPTFDLQGNTAAPGNGVNGEASGYYLEGGYYIPNSKWEIDLRYDVYNRLEGDAQEIEFVTTTIGAQYHINKKTRINMEISDRSAEAINFGAGAGPNANLDGVDKRTAVQLTHIF